MPTIPICLVGQQYLDIFCDGMALWWAKTALESHFFPFVAKTAPVLLSQNSPSGGKNNPGKPFWHVWSQNNPSFIMSK